VAGIQQHLLCGCAGWKAILNPQVVSSVQVCDELRWPRPVRSGDELRIEIEIPAIHHLSPGQGRELLRLGLLP
jgi:acyl dehydratase